MKSAYIGLGSNLGDRLVNLHVALSKMNERKIRIVRRSSVYRTPAWGDTAQPYYLNQVAQAEVRVGPLELLKELKAIEIDMGRKEHGWSQPRVIDLDIVAYGDEVIDESELKIPHPLLAQRGFVLIPLNEIAPDFVDPISRKSIKKMLGDIDANGIEIYCD